MRTHGYLHVSQLHRETAAQTHVQTDVQTDAGAQTPVPATAQADA